MNTKLKVTEIQRFCMHDGPGLRTTVFLKGCPLKCAWCHNPETQKREDQLLFYLTKCIGCQACACVCKAGAHSIGEKHTIDRDKCISCFDCVSACPTNALEKCGNDMTIDEIIAVVKKDVAFYGQNGGITVSGGEPFMQGENVVTLLNECKKLGFSTAVETCGFADTDILLKATEFVDLFLWDIKDTNDLRHKEYTGVSNQLILENLKAINEKNAKIRLRCILVNGVNTDMVHYENIVSIAKTINNLDGVEFIPYHSYSGTKSVFIGLTDSGKTEWIPTKEQVDEAKEFLTKQGVTVC